MCTTTFKSISLILLVFILISCRKGESLQGAIFEKAKDKEITKEEFNELLNFVKSDAKYKKYTNPSELYTYIIKVAELSKENVNVYNPVNPQSVSSFNIDVFLENSKSMDGYVTGTDLKNSVYELLENLKGHCNTLNLHYINDKITYTVSKAGADENKAFILNLSPAAFVQHGGKRGVSDMAEVIKVVLQQTRSHNLSILISDFVFSPGKGVDADAYLNIQKTSIKTAIRDKSGMQDLCVAVYQMNSYFNGDYYDHNNKTIKYKGQRPYYIWFIGTSEQVQILLNNKVIRKSDDKLLNSIVFKNTAKEENISYKIVKVGKTGNFALTSTKGEIIDAKPEQDKFGFSLALNFAGNIRGDDYFLDVQNYKLNDDNYKLSARLLTEKEKAGPDLKGFTHLLTLSTTKLISETLEIKITARSPRWIAQSSSVNDAGILNDSTEQSKTFGFKYLMNGVAEAFNIYGDSEQSLVSRINLVIKK
jgi:hypothetical protein